ncbi:BatA domain-containing protein [Cellulophaga tyrosinoxydans]|uniref:N-terminal double-transmembrane domain-containing protein n=1 Tax=Cellulophaga tyrosinoxydans TaxID=504486 RepID=A0A1W2B0B4_9FLAO|nr:BatA domain-containing protein [Cellulophaga tyrosinoxydans]SMC65868.1 N-terminal double-transmembrane domain-containing protein [Cellulophaga tyrosinoxydans]
MTFGNPFYLWTLLGLLVPIAIHLWSKKEAKIIKIGSVKFLTPSDSKQSSRLKLNELWLLFLRMFIISILAIILSEPQWQSKSKNISITYIVDPILLNTETIAKIVSEPNDTTEIRILTINLPVWKDDAIFNSKNHATNYWQLISEMNSLDSDSIVVLSHAFLQDFKGKRPEIFKPIRWIQMDSVNTLKLPLQVIQKSENLELRSVLTSKNRTAIIKENILANNSTVQFNNARDSVTLLGNTTSKKLAISKQEPIEILLNFTDSLKMNKSFITTSFQVLEEYLNRPFIVSEIEKTAGQDLSKYDLVVWFSETDIPNNAKRILVFNEDKFADGLIQETKYNNRFQLTSHLNIENSIDGNLIEALLKILELDSELKDQIKRADQRQFATSEITANRLSKKSSDTRLATLDISKWFWMALLFFMILERVIAKYRKQ